MRAASQRSPSAMRNIYRSSPFYRRHWFLALVIVLLIFAMIGAVVGYTIHLQFVDKAASFDMDELGKMESASTIFDRQGATFGYIYEQKREPIPIAQMPLDLQHAVVSAEDNRFYTHNGSDFRGMLRASLKNLRSNRIRQGASTITQQLARNTFPLKGRTFSRKILEIYVARRIETTLSKDQIMEYYLNRIYLGSGLYGIEAASKGYFGKAARDLTLGEAATLAGLIKSPNNLSPWHDRQAAQAARDFVLGRMVDEEYISRAQMQEAVAEPLAVKPRILASSDSYALEAIRQQVIAQVGLDRATSAGLKIYTTIDARLQKVAEEALRAQLNVVESNPSFQNHQTYAQYADKFREEEKRAVAASQDPSAPPVNLHNVVGAPEYLQGSLIVLNNSDASILAMVGGRDFQHSEFNRATNPQARRPAGTAFTPFVYAAAYQKGIFPGRLFLDQVIDNRQVMVGGQSGILGEWGVERADNHYEGPISAQMALIEGKNAATVRVGNEVGLDDVLALAKRGGINSPLRNFPATFLGSSELTLSELALAYTSFPNGGWHAAAPHLLTKIADADGEVLYQDRPRTRLRMIDEGPAYQVHVGLQQDLTMGNAAAATRQLGLKSMAAGGKPGTSYNFSDALFAGYNSEVTCAVWEGFDKPSPIYRGAFGSQVALPVWVDVMNAAAQYLPPHDIPVPRMLKKVEICDRSGDLATDRCFEVVDGTHVRTTFTTYATAAQMPTQRCPVHGGGRSAAAALASARALEPVIQSVAGGPPRAIAVVDTAGVTPVAIKSPTVLLASGKDPYDAVVPVIAAPSDAAPGKTADGQNQPVAASTTKEVRRAMPVSAAEPDTAAPAVKVDPPDQLQFN
jgi:membrane peptidoglycan carboxypeptidase